MRQSYIVQNTIYKNNLIDILYKICVIYVFCTILELWLVSEGKLTRITKKSNS